MIPHAVFKYILQFYKGNNFKLRFKKILKFGTIEAVLSTAVHITRTQVLMCGKEKTNSKCILQMLQKLKSVKAPQRLVMAGVLS